MQSLTILLSIAVTLIVLLGAIIGALFGLLRGFKRSIVTVIGTATAALLAFLLAKPITGWIANFVFEKVGIKNLIPMYNDLVEVSPALGEFISVLPVAIVAPIVFLVLFVILKLIVKIPCGIISLSMGSKSDRRVLGMPIGAGQGIISALVIVFVITGFISTADNLTTAIKNDKSTITQDLRSTVDDFDDVIEATKKDPVVKILCRKAPAKSELTTSVNFVYSGLTTFKLNNQKANLNEELVGVINTLTCITPIASNTDVTKWSDTEIAALQKFADKMNQSVLLKNVGTDFVSGACTKWSNNEKFMGMERPKADAMIDPIISALFGSFKNTTVNTIHDDLTTVIELFKTFNRHNVFSSLTGNGDSSNMMSALSGDLVKEVLEVLNSNPHGHFNALVGEVTNLGLRLLAQTLNLPENNNEIYTNLTDDIAEKLTDVVADGITEEEITQLANDTKSILAENGIDVSEEAVQVVTDGIVEKFANEGGEISGEKVQEFFQEFAVAYDSTEGFMPEGEQSKTDDGLANLASKKGNSSNPGNVNLSNMSYQEKLAVLAQLGVYDHYNALYNLADKSPDDVLSNGEVADEYVEYIIKMTLTVGNNRDKVSNSKKPSKKPAVTTLSSPETMVTTKVTVESLLVDPNLELSKEDIEQIGAGFDAITLFMESYSALGGGELGLEQLAQLDMMSAGKALDLLKSIPAFNNTVDQISYALISQVAGSDIDIIEKINSGNVTYENLFVTVKSTAQVLGSINNIDATDEDKEQAILDLLLNLTPETADIVNEIVTEDFIIKQGVPKEIAKQSAQALRSAFIEMANLPADEHEAETKYVTKMFELSVYVKDKDKKNGVIGPNGLFKSEEELVSTTIHSTVASAALKSISVDENGAPIYDALSVADDLSEVNKYNITNHMKIIYEETKANNASAEELKELESRILVASYLLVLDIDFIG